MKSIPRADGKTEEVLVIAFADDARLYVPLEQSYLVSRYVGVGKRNPPLSALGDGKWAKAKKNAEKAVFDYASKLLAVHAETRDGARLRLSARHQMAARIRVVVSFQGNSRSAHRHHRDEDRHGIRAPHGPAHLRRRGLWQNRGGNSRSVQVRDEREASRHPRSHDGSRRAALSQIFANA